MDENTNLADSIIKKIEKYLKIQVELVKLQSLDKFSSIASTLVVRTFVLILLLVFLLALSVAAALYLGEILGKVYFGFLIIAGFYGLVTLIVRYGFRNQLRKQVANFIIKEILK